MFVWIAQLHYPYSSDEVLGVYSTQELAKAECQKHSNINLVWLIGDAVTFNKAFADEIGNDFYTVDRYKIDE